MIPALSAADAAALLAQSGPERPLLLDVREPWELEIARVEGAVHIPMGQIPSRHDELPSDRPVICLCHHGVRSFQVGVFLARQGFESVYNLRGGIDAWSREVDPSVALY